MKAIQINEYGDPGRVLRVVELPDPAAPGAGEVLVEPTYAPLNFHDLKLVEGGLVRLPLPLVPGNEGIGVVRVPGAGVTSVRAGDLVCLPLLSGTWRERLVVPAPGLAALPDADPRQLSMIGSNSPTASLALSEYGDLQPGDWVVQNGANGGVGRNLIAFARKRGIRTVNLVRRPDVIPEIVAAGGDIVLPDTPDAVDQVRRRIGAGTPLTVAVDSLGGASAVTLARLLSPGGALVYYANSAGDPIGAENDLVTTKSLTVSSLFVGAFDRQTRLVPLIAESAGMVASGEISVPVAAVYPLAKIADAVGHLHRGGKILLEVSPA